MDKMKIKIIQTTTDSKITAEFISEILVNNNIAPCVQIFPNIQSVYKWKDKLEKTNEILLFIKTVPENVEQCKDIILEHHNYEIPEIIVTDGDILEDHYKDWFIGDNREI